MTHSTPAVTAGARLGVQFEGKVEDNNHQQGKDQHRRKHLAPAQFSGQVLPHNSPDRAQKTVKGSGRIEVLDWPAAGLLAM